MATTGKARTSHGPRRRPASSEPVADPTYALWASRAALWTVVGTVLVFWRSAGDVFGTPKLTVLWLGATISLLLLAADALVNRRVLLPWGGGPLLLVIFFVVTVATAAASGLGMQAVLGSYSRYVGLGTYAAVVVLALAVCAGASLSWAEELARGITVATGVVAAYGLVQIVGADPFTWADTPKHVAFSTLGQENFAAGFLASALSLVSATALLDRDRRWRQVAAAVFVAGLIALWSSHSFQGAIAVVALLPLVWTLRARLLAPVRGRERRWAPIAAVAAVPVVVLLPKLLRFGLREVRVGTSERTELWHAALDLSRDHLLVGRGFSAYGREFVTVRRLPYVQKFGWLQLSDSPHNVFLEHLVGGGILLVAAYLALVAYTGFVAVGSLRRADPAYRPWIAAIVGGWAAYVGQSLVSIDVPAIAATGFLLTASVLVVGNAAVSRRLGAPHRPKALAYSAMGGGAVVFLLVGWQLVRPLRADLAAGQGKRAAARHDVRHEISSYTSAANLAPWEPQYQAELAQAYGHGGNPSGALEPGRKAAESGPGNSVNVLSYAALLKQTGHVADAERWYLAAARRDRFAGPVQGATGGYFVEQHQPDRALPYLERATRFSPTDERFWTLYGQALAAVGRRDEARTAFKRALAITPSEPIATAGLESLDATP